MALQGYSLLSLKDHGDQKHSLRLQKDKHRPVFLREGGKKIQGTVHLSLERLWNKLSWRPCPGIGKARSLGTASTDLPRTIKLIASSDGI